MSHNTHEGIRNLSLVSSISLALLFFYFIIHNNMSIFVFLLQALFVLSIKPIKIMQ